MAAGRLFGIITSTTGFTGIVVTSLDKQTTVEVAEARDSSGKVTDQKAYSKKVTYSVTGLLDTASFSIEAGSTLSLTEGSSSVTYLITDASVKESNTGFAEVSLTVTRSDSATIAAYA